jgi:hypothetical protein
MMSTTIAPVTAPAILPPVELLPPEEFALEDGVGVEDTPEGPRIEPGPASGESMKNVE